MSRTVNTSTVGQVDLNNADAPSGASISNTQRVINSIASSLGITTAEAFNYLITWSSDIVGAPNDTVVGRIEALVERFSGSTGHTHSGVDGEGQKIASDNLGYTITNDSNTGDIDDLANDGFGIVRLTGIGATNLRGIVAPSSGSKQLIIMNLTGSDLTVQNEDANPAAGDQIVTGNGGELAILDGGAFIVQYDPTSAIWRAVSGSGGGLSVGYQEALAGTVDGINDTFGPLSLTPLNEDSILVFVNGLEAEKSSWSLSGSDIVFVSPPAAASELYVFYLYKLTGSTPPSVGLGTTPKTEFRTITALEESNKQLTLTQTPVTPSEIRIDVYGGSIGWYNVDYTVSGSIVDWDTLGFDGILTAGDMLRITYYYT